MVRQIHGTELGKKPCIVKKSLSLSAGMCGVTEKSIEIKACAGSVGEKEQAQIPMVMVSSERVYSFILLVSEVEIVDRPTVVVAKKNSPPPPSN